MRARRCLIALALLVAGSVQAASPPAVKKVETATPLAYSGTTGPRSVIYRRTMMTVSNEKFGSVGRGFFCSNPQPLTMINTVVNAVAARFASAARRELRQLGYVDAIEEQSAFSRAPGPSGDFELAASLRGIEAHMCTDGPRETNGGVWMQLRWELFAAKQQTVVHSLTTEGSFSTEKFAELTIDDLFERAFVSALKNALADPTMAQKLASDASAAAVAPAPDARKPRLALARLPVVQDVPDAEFTMHRSSVVTLLSGVGSGSGFFIDALGYLLTNYHVVGDAKYVKVRLASGRELVGEVLRSDPVRDVALVKTEAVALRPLAIAKPAPAVGDELVIISSPFGEAFASSLSKGVLSGVSVVDGLQYLQSDAKALPGSSGGPLIRRDGSVVGLVQSSVGVVPGAGLNLFVPIDDALSRLGIDFKP